MAWYGGQNGAIKDRLYTAMGKSLGEFRSKIAPSSFVTFRQTIKDGEKGSNLLINSPLKQEDMFKEINEKLPVCDAFEISCSDQLIDFVGISDEVANNLKGLAIYCVMNLSEDGLLNFIKRTPNLTALVLVGITKLKAKRFVEIFETKQLNSLQYLDMDGECNDEVINSLMIFTEFYILYSYY